MRNGTSEAGQVRDSIYEMIFVAAVIRAIRVEGVFRRPLAELSAAMRPGTLDTTMLRAVLATDKIKKKKRKKKKKRRFLLQKGSVQACPGQLRLSLPFQFGPWRFGFSQPLGRPGLSSHASGQHFFRQSSISCESHHTSLLHGGGGQAHPSSTFVFRASTFHHSYFVSLLCSALFVAFHSCDFPSGCFFETRFPRQWRLFCLAFSASFFFLAHCSGSQTSRLRETTLGRAPYQENNCQEGRKTGSGRSSRDPPFPPPLPPPGHLLKQTQLRLSPANCENSIVTLWSLHSGRGNFIVSRCLHTSAGSAEQRCSAHLPPPCTYHISPSLPMRSAK